MIDEEIIDGTPEAAEMSPTEEELSTEGAPAFNGEQEEPRHEQERASIDYAAIAESDLKELKMQFPELYDIEDLTELDNPVRYAGLRDLGLTPKEAYLATSTRQRRTDNRSHLSSAMPRGAGAPRGGISREELYRARELFEGMSDAEIQALYRRVNA